jgi:hypothetical protein
MGNHRGSRRFVIIGSLGLIMGVVISLVWWFGTASGDRRAEEEQQFQRVVELRQELQKNAPKMTSDEASRRAAEVRQEAMKLPPEERRRYFRQLDEQRHRDYIDTLTRYAAASHEVKRKILDAAIDSEINAHRRTEQRSADIAAGKRERPQHPPIQPLSVEGTPMTAEQIQLMNNYTRDLEARRKQRGVHH